MIETFVINMKNRPDRLEKFSKKAKNNNIHWEVIEAVNGHKLNRKEYEIDCYRSIKRGELGCYLSHYKVYETAKDNITLVLEDDVSFKKDFDKKFKLATDKLPPDVDVLFLGGTLSWWRKHKNKYGKIEPVNDIFYEVKGVIYGAEGYLIRKDARQKMINNKYPVRYPGGDVPLCSNGLKVYCLVDPIVKQGRYGSNTKC